MYTPGIIPRWHPPASRFRYANLMMIHFYFVLLLLIDTEKSGAVGTLDLEEQSELVYLLLWKSYCFQ